ncbi:hypothetical protein INR49_031948 [Caranx melampygus]|nr:hypothetical protein INR49_031948 [Caranx melampygus]
MADPALFQYPCVQVDVPEHVVGDKTDGEEDHQDRHQLQTPLLQHRVHVGFSGENHDDVSVTDQDDDQADAVRQVAADQVVGGGVETRVRRGQVVLVKEHVWEDLGDHQEPDQSADGHRVPAGDFPHHPHGVHDAQIPVNADADGTCPSVAVTGPHSQGRTVRLAVAGDWRQVDMLQEQDSIIITCCWMSLPWGQRKSIHTVLVCEGLQQPPSGQVRVQNLGRLWSPGNRPWHGLTWQSLVSVCMRQAWFLLVVRVETPGPQLWEQGLQSEVHSMQLEMGPNGRPDSPPP